jgi:putative toxin-antitoxin system antitoxin component (TIGR02293 family)
MSGSPEDFLIKEPYFSVYQLDAPSIIETVRNGIAFDFFTHLSKLIPFSQEEWSRILHLTERSLQRYKKENKTFDPLQSEKIIQIMLLYKKGISVFGTKSLFDQWLDSISPALGHVTPKHLLDSSFGIELVQDELIRIEHGVLA